MGSRAASLVLAALCASAAPAAGRAEEARVLFGAGLSLGGVTFAPSAFSSSWAGYNAMGTGEPQPVSRGPDSSGAATIAAAFKLHTGPSGTAVFSGTGAFSETPDGGVRAEWRITADRNGRFNEAFVGANLPLSRIGGGTAILDGAEVPIPAERGPKGHLFRAPASSLDLRGPDGTTILHAVFDEPTSVLLQDNRHWNGDGLGIRLFFATGSCETGREYAVRAQFFAGGSGAAPPSLVAAGTVRITAGPDWIPLAQEPWIEPGSALDFSAAIPRHAPAGTFGRVVVRGGHFEFERLPGVPQRFYGVNVCGDANVPETAEEADRFAANLARIGYNAVRIHHHERHLVGEDGTTPDPAQMAKFDLLVAACVEHGLYLTTDLFVSRSHALPWREIGIDRDGTVPSETFKILCAFHEPAFSNLCAWARAFLTHVNPHTGRALAEEPALATLALVNEGNLGNWGAATLRDSPIVATAWRQWLAAKRNDERRCAANDDGAPRQMTNDENVVIAGEAGSSLRGTAAHVIAPQAPVIVWDEIPDTIPDNLYSQPFATFLADAETRLYERLRDFVRDELRCPVPLSSLSAWFEPEPYALPRAAFDYIDTHFYVDHPKFLDRPWRLPSSSPNANPLRGSSRGAQDCVWIRQFGKPFTVSEFNFCGPGRYRGVGGIATGALAALQDWDGLWRFDWSYNRDGMVGRAAPMGFFDVASDPLSLAAERAALCLFLRGDLAPLAAEEPLVLDPAALRDPAHGARFLPSLGDNAKAWRSRVGTRLSGPAGLSAASRLSGSSSLSNHVSREATLPPRSGDVSGEAARNGVYIDVTGSFLIETPRTCGGFAESGTHTAGPLTFALLASGKSAASPPVSGALPLSGPPALSQLSREAALSPGGALSREAALSPEGALNQPVAATVWVSALDGEPIATSSHLLLTHLTDVQNTGIEYADPDRTILLKWGWLPHLTRNGSARIELSLNGEAHIMPQSGDVSGEAARNVGKPAWRVYRLSPSGRRLGEIPSSFDPATGTLSFIARTDYDPAAATYLYEIVR